MLPCDEYLALAIGYSEKVAEKLPGETKGLVNQIKTRQ